MISVIHTYNKKFRAFGWIQDSGNLRSLCDVVALFDKESEKHKELVTYTIPKLIAKENGRDRLVNTLKQDILKISYLDLVGTSFSPRSASKCNGIIQACVKGQKRAFILDWPADNFLRWVHSLGFVEYNYSDETFCITKLGLKLSKASVGKNEELSEEEKSIITDALLAYPPAIRILKLLETENTHLTKFEIGKQLGFVGDGGFTSLSQNVLVRELSEMNNPKEKNELKNNWEGSSDKYSRMIAGWLVKLKLLQKIPKKIKVTIGKKEYSEDIGQSYAITALGITALHKAEGKSKHRRIPKNIFWEMFATNGADREYLRTRRAFVLKAISEGSGEISIITVVEYLKNRGIDTDKETVKDDVAGLINIGIDIIISKDNFIYNDKIKDFTIYLPKELVKSELLSVKDNLRSNMKQLSHEYLSLIDLAYDSKQDRLFEKKTMELLIDECFYKGIHLGGSRKPDGVIYTDKLNNNYGVIIDTKAYSKGYSVDIKQADEMVRYISENKNRDIEINPNKWWNNFSSDIKNYYFMFIAGHFKGSYKNQLERISKVTKSNGVAMSVANLLAIADKLKSDSVNHKWIEENVFMNDTFQI